MKKIEIYEFQLKEIIEAFRMTNNIHNCSSKETCFDRTVNRAYEYSKNALDGKIDNKVNYM